VLAGLCSLVFLKGEAVFWRAVKIGNNILKVTASKSYKWFVCSGVFYSVLIALNACTMPAFIV